MKPLVIAAAAVAALGLSTAAAQAQPLAPTTWYGSVGYAGTHVEGVGLGAIQGRLGARFGRYLGVEGELGFGVKGDTINVLGTDTDFRLNHQEAAYVVGFYPVTPNLDIFARGGYGHTRLSQDDGVTRDHFNEDSWNYGAGAQYFLNGRDGVRADWTRHDFTGSSSGNADVWAVGYSHRF